MKKAAYILLISFFSAVFVFLSFLPNFYEITHKDNIPSDRYLNVEHNSIQDYNFYISRIRMGQEKGRWLVSEKYYNKEHKGSLIQSFYLYTGKLGGVFNIDPPAVYHIMRLLLGFFLLFLAGIYSREVLKSYFWGFLGFMSLALMGSFPILVWLEGGIPRFGSFMGWWSVVDPHQRVAFIPHVLFGQIAMLLFFRLYFLPGRVLGRLKLLSAGIFGFLSGMVFPPTLILMYSAFFIHNLSLFLKTLYEKGVNLKAVTLKMFTNLIPALIFFILSLPALLYLQLNLKVLPWQQLALFDVEHRIHLAFIEFIPSMGPLFFLAVLGIFASIRTGGRRSNSVKLIAVLAIIILTLVSYFLTVKAMPLTWEGLTHIYTSIAVNLLYLAILFYLIRGDEDLRGSVLWLGGMFLLFAVFEYVPLQSPIRFTESAQNIPIGILSVYLIRALWMKAGLLKGKVKKLLAQVTLSLSYLSVLVMSVLMLVSMTLWLYDQAIAKAYGTWPVPRGVQLGYQMRDFMDAVFYLRDNTDIKDVVLAYETAGNYIPAHAGNFVYLGHSNTPGQKQKLAIAERFYSGRMGRESALNFLKEEGIRYIFWGPQEREFGNNEEIAPFYPFLKEVFSQGYFRIYTY